MTADGKSSDGLREEPNRSDAVDLGLDLAGLDERLAMSPEERIRRHDQALELVQFLRQAGIRYYGFDPRPPETSR